MFLRKMDEADVDRKGIENWLDDRFNDDSENLNGRQIRNILSCAIDLARSEKTKLQLTHIKTIFQTTKTFKTHLHNQTILAKRQNE